ncbi:probable multidrug resistance-associated protein lethal(2)03659 isoform X2 [Leptinotarsa decemlineata]|uniref:probable multidrug resistance-associated protein lethal(2)03659 isoform X2 n=1 Tax=Leptinotarsa decemlineata TaxID=7539 RepID=UPI003D304268
MDPATEKYNPNPREGANILSVVSYWYTLPIFRKGMRKTLDVDDIYNPLKQDRSTLLGDKLERNWNEQIEKTKKNGKGSPSLLKVIFQTFWLEIAQLGLMIGFGDIVIRVSQPYVLGLLLDYYSPVTTTTQGEALFYAGCIILFNLSIAFIRSQYMMCARHVGIKIRTGVCSLVYRKAAKLNQSALGKSPTGKIVNLLSNDISRIDMAATLVHQMWIGPITAVIVLFIVFKNIGFSGTPGILIILAVLPIQVYVGSLSARFRKRIAMKTDERIRLMNEVISGIQVIKMYAWEKPFEKLVTFARKAEIRIIRRGAYVRAIFMAFSLFSNRFALFATLVSMALSGQSITAQVYVFMSYFQILAQTLAGVFARGLSAIAELLVSIRRIQDFLNNEEYDFALREETKYNVHDDDTTYSVTLNEITASWDKSSSNPVLKNINLKVRKGKLTGVIGPVGSGKSSLLQTLLGELTVTSGNMKIFGTTSYSSQEPWVFSGTIRQNILFGAEYNQSRYKEVIRVCDLEKDFDKFLNRDDTIIGDKGASLSGGQKARVNLARAVYRDRDIYLLDDPLSAVDIHVAKILYEQCINGFLAHKTRILVTHQVHWLKNADNIAILNESVVSGRSIKIEKPSEKIQQEIHRGISRKELQEESSKGKVGGSLLLKYFSSGMSCFKIFIIFAILAFTQGVSNGIDWFISFWTTIEEYRNVTLPEEDTKNIPTVDWSTETCLYIYGTALFILLCGTLSRSILFYKFLMKCSVRLHAMLFKGIIHAPMRFFDTNPSGRVLNRFSKDIGSIDEPLPRVLFENMRTFTQMAGSLALVLYVNPYTIILLAVLVFVFSLLRRVYLKSSKNIKRLEGMMRSPAFTHLSATLQGLTTIRALDAGDILEKEFDRHQDYYTSAFFMFVSTNAAFGFTLNMCCIIFVGILTFSLITFKDFLGMTGGQVGLAITQATNLCSNVQFAMMYSAEIINQLMSVERVLEYSKLPPEVEPVIPTIPPKSWPNAGAFKFVDLKFKYYDDGPEILRNLNFSISQNDKVGIVGRTGAGKSSLVGAILRMAIAEGKIEIDGININNIPLEILRSKISIIPQDPVLFSGTLRYNLDPFGEYTDEMLYKALNEVELKDSANIINQLENMVMDRGSNYSVGQKQLICLARAILRNNKVLMLDEATANVDPQTDELIQKTIRTKFADCTVLTIAHRLNTIMDSDKVLVMDAGEVVEYDHPHILLQNPNGFFYKLVEENGTNMSEQLQKVAAESYERKLNNSISGK